MVLGRFANTLGQISRTIGHAERIGGAVVRGVNAYHEYHRPKYSNNRYIGGSHGSNYEKRAPFKYRKKKKRRKR